MSFWKKLISNKTKLNTNLTDFEPIAKNVSSEETELFLALLESVKDFGHFENPLLRKEYDLLSRIPSCDFSVWLVDRLQNKDYESVWAFIKKMYGDDKNGGGGINIEGMLNEIAPAMMVKKYGISLKEANKQWSNLMAETESNDNFKNTKSWRRQLFENFLDIDLFEYIEGDEKLFYEIQVFFILKSGLDKSLRGFWIGDENTSGLLAKVLCVNRFSIKNLGFEKLILKANDFLKQIKKEAKKDGIEDGWKLVPYFSAKDLKQTLVIDTKTNILIKLQSLGLGERLHFFDFASSRKFPKYWSGNSSYKTRSLGVNEAESIKKMVELDLFLYTNDIESIPVIASKGELKEKAENNGFKLLKSWTLLKIYENLLKTEEGKIFLQNFIQEKKGLKFNEAFNGDLLLILELQEKIKVISNLLSMI